MHFPQWSLPLVKENSTLMEKKNEENMCMCLEGKFSIVWTREGLKGIMRRTHEMSYQYTGKEMLGFWLTLSACSREKRVSIFSKRVGEKRPSKENRGG